MQTLAALGLVLLTLQYLDWLAMTCADWKTAVAASVYSCSSYSSGSRTFSRLKPPRNLARLRLKAVVPSKVYLLHSYRGVQSYEQEALRHVTCKAGQTLENSPSSNIACVQAWVQTQICRWCRKTGQTCVTRLCPWALQQLQCYCPAGDGKCCFINSRHTTCKQATCRA